MTIYNLKLQEPFKAIIKLKTGYCHNLLDVTLNLVVQDKIAKLAVHLLLRNSTIYSNIENELYNWSLEDENGINNIQFIIKNELDYQAVTRVLHVLFAHDAYLILVDLNRRIDYTITHRLTKQDILSLSAKEQILTLKQKPMDHDLPFKEHIDYSDEQQIIKGLLLFAGFSYGDASITASSEYKKHHCDHYIRDIEEGDEKQHNNNDRSDTTDEIYNSITYTKTPSTN